MRGQDVLLGTPCRKGFRQVDTPVSESSRWRISWYLAETQGFEPWIQVLPRCALSRGVNYFLMKLVLTRLYE